MKARSAILEHDWRTSVNSLESEGLKYERLRSSSGKSFAFSER